MKGFTFEYFRPVDALFQDASILPVQFETPQRLTAEQQLCLAILQNAIDDLHQWRSNVLRLAERPIAADYWTWQVREVERWFRSDSDRHPFYFVPICQALHLDPSYVRRVLTTPSPDGQRVRRFSHRVRPGRSGRTRDVGHW